ncbi:MAG TPA: hypothetical protein VJ818_07375 [Actinomycetota bacterium]|nr:hypothetical protein [Actinomycetota bacterium]
MGDELIDDRVPDAVHPDEARVRRRADALEEDNPTSVDDTERQARAMLGYSDALQEDPATRDLEDGRVERRTSEDATPPPDA